MAALGSQTIASSYEQLLHVDTDGGGNTTTLVPIKDGDNGTTFCLQIATTSALINGSGSRLYFSDAGGEHISGDGTDLTIAAGTALNITADIIDLSDATKDITLNAAVDALNFDSNTLSIDASNNRIGIGTASPKTAIHTVGATGNPATSGTTPTAIARFASTYNSVLDIGQHASPFAMWIQSHDASNLAQYYNLSLQPDGGNVGIGTTAPSVDLVVSNGGANGIELNAGASASTIGAFNRSTSSYTPLTLETAKLTFAPQGTNPVVIDQGANDGEALSLKSSDVAHPQTNTSEADTYGRMMKASATGGGLRIDGFNDSNNIALEMIGNAQGDSSGRATDTNGAVVMRGVKTTGNDPGDLPSNTNILVVANRNTVRFIFDTDGDFHADSSSTTFDQYNDAQLVRAFDLSHGKGVIKSKFDEFINYQHETLAELDLVGREEDGTPNHFVNVTGMQRLHNGAIWQQYTEMQKMKELMYDTMVEMLGKSKADAKLKDHDIKLLDNKNLLN